MGMRLLKLLEEDPNPGDAMAWIAEIVDRRDLIHPPGAYRMDEPLPFVMDVWWHNPLMPDLFNLLASQPTAEQIAEIDDLIDLVQWFP